MDLTVFNDQVLFAGRDTNFSYDLWTTSWNGAAFVTVDLNKTGAGITGAGKGFDPTDLTVFGGEVLFNGVNTAGHNGLWATNETAAAAVGTLATESGRQSGPSRYRSVRVSIHRVQASRRARRRRR